MQDKKMKALIKEAIGKAKEKEAKILQKERAMRVQMFKDSITTAIACLLLSILPIILLAWAGFTFLTGIFITVFATLLAMVIYMIIKDDNKTREKRVNERLKR